MGAPDVVDHYGRTGIFDEIIAQLEAAGRRPAELGRDDLAGVDEFHLGGRRATDELLDRLALEPASQVLDIGCGIGGAARAIAGRVGATVHGIDLTAEFVETARRLSDATGLSDLTDFRVGTALDLPFDDARFDVVTMLHVGMNIADKSALACEMARVLRPGGRVAIYDVMRLSDGSIEYPMPWASDERTSFLSPPSTYVEALTAAGFEPTTPENWTDLVREAIRQAQLAPPAVHLGHLMGAEWATMFAHLGAAMSTGVVAPIQIVAGLRAGD